MNAQSNPTDQQWGPCPPGELGRMVGQLRGKRRSARLRRMGGAVAVVALFAVVLVGGRRLLRGSGNDMVFGGIACSEVAPQMMAFHEGKCPAPLAEKIRRHLAQCPVCGPKYEKMFGPLVRRAEPPGTADTAGNLASALQARAARRSG